MVSLPIPSDRRTFTFKNALQGFLLHDDLPFASILDGDRVNRIFGKHKSCFGGIFQAPIVLWAFMSQVLRDGKEASCQSAVARISAFLLRSGRKPPTSDTGDYCRARAKLSEQALKELSVEISDEAEQQSDINWLWKGRHAKLVDGFTFKMPDTPENQAAYPQHTAQKPGLGFPIARVACLLSLATGAVINAAMGRYKGSKTGEVALFEQIFSSLSKGDVVVADRHYCSYWLICVMIQLGVDICFRKHQARHTDFRKGQRLGKYDHVVAWVRPKRPQWMSQEDYEKLPEKLVLREIQYAINEPGRKQQPFVVMTSMLDVEGDQAISKEDIAELYGFRWNVELDIRSIKVQMNLSHLRCLSPEMIRREFWTTMLAYNLIRTTIALAAKLTNKKPRQIGFTSACQYVLASWQEVCRIEGLTELKVYCETLLKTIATCEVSNRPGRLEPRVVKRRRDQYTLMMQPRNELRRRLARHDNSFE